jgi:hypothetical protein
MSRNPVLCSSARRCVRDLSVSSALRNPAEAGARLTRRTLALWARPEVREPLWVVAALGLANPHATAPLREAVGPRGLVPRSRSSASPTRSCAPG